MAGIGDRPGADGFGLDHAAIAARCGRIGRVHLLIKRGEAPAIFARCVGIGGIAAKRAPFEAAQSFDQILGPADTLTELAVADHVDAGIVLLADNPGNGSA